MVDIGRFGTSIHDTNINDKTSMSPELDMLLIDSSMDRKKFEHAALTQIRKQSLDPYNRLHSIAEDIDFVQIVHEKYASYPLLANLRCGAWYADPLNTNGITTHFKSADGHYNAWSFNLRRPNLHILPLILDAHGICIVDSTRSGKRVPDSFSKTIPIWCAVVNRALVLRRAKDNQDNGDNQDDWDVELYTPPQSVSRQERSQISEKLDGWANELARSTYSLPNLHKPLRPIWITPATSTLPVFSEQGTAFYPVICISASKCVEEGVERRRHGYSYVQGAGDDHENWSLGLTPETFWRHRDELLSASELEFSEVLEKIIKLNGRPNPCTVQPSPIAERKEWMNHPMPVVHVKGLLSICKLSDIPQSILRLNPPTPPVPQAEDTNTDTNIDAEQEKIDEFICSAAHAYAYIVIRSYPRKTSTNESKSKSTPSEGNTCSEGYTHIHEVTLPTDKKGAERAFKASLPSCLAFIRHHLLSQVSQPRSESKQRYYERQTRICVACETGTDLSVGVVLVALQAFFDDSGNLDLTRWGEARGEVVVNKETLRTRLHWIIASRPEANPSRATLKRVNEFFMSSPFIAR